MRRHTSHAGEVEALQYLDAASSGDPRLRQQLRGGWIDVDIMRLRTATVFEIKMRTNATFDEIATVFRCNAQHVQRMVSDGNDLFGDDPGFARLCYDIRTRFLRARL